MLEFVMVLAMCQPMEEGCAISNVRLRVYPDEAACLSRVEPVQSQLERRSYTLGAQKFFCMSLAQVCGRGVVRTASLGDVAASPRKDVSAATRALLCP